MDEEVVITEEKQSLISFAELEIAPKCDIVERIAKHTGQAGAVFGPRGIALRNAKDAEDHVKYIKGKVELDLHYAGKMVIQGPNENDEPKELTKYTVPMIKAYVESHPEVVAAKKEEAKTAMYLDNARAVANMFLDVKEHLKTLQSARINEFYSDPTDKTAGKSPGGYR